jgi:hypothetical protein
LTLKRLRGNICLILKKKEKEVDVPQEMIAMNDPAALRRGRSLLVGIPLLNAYLRDLPK